MVKELQAKVKTLKQKKQRKEESRCELHVSELKFFGQFFLIYSILDV